MILFATENNIQICELSKISVDLDTYLSWLRNVADNRFIESARADYSMDDLKNYLTARCSNPSVRFWGIFLKDGKFIGTIKLEPIDWNERTAWVGILIGDVTERGKGYGTLAMSHVLAYASYSLGLKEVFLGVRKENVPAIRTYEKLGFVILEANADSYVMRKQLPIN